MDPSGESGSNSPVAPIDVDDDAVDMEDMDNLEERIANLEVLFAYLKMKKMLETQETTSMKANEEIAVCAPPSKSKGSTSNAKQGRIQKPVTKQVQTITPQFKSPVPIRNCILGLPSPSTTDAFRNKASGRINTTEGVVTGQEKKGKKKV